ncbi:TSUP family transporter [Falsarthrobacter nasiphocae]|uniref:Probable membrane transporter protein n=1 Tax=Falsarthrobacter nasiphocae TaxID=189863 RepID=A0AAE3YII3_9MICC|nr:TSUP family transporter [Falsarthrobacter nasiphocae]MDR6892646.1 putative membrane protein YfcA [Falsarthrobacter nasiphocae]
MEAFLGDISPWLLLLVFAAGLAAGWVDAVVGGGGLIQLPALLLIPGFSPIQAVATNKVGSVFGTSVSAVTYARRIRPEPKPLVLMGAGALAGSLAGAQVAKQLPSELFTPIILAALFCILVITILRPSLGQVEALRHTDRGRTGRGVVLATGIGFYDGVLGPGTGSFFVMALVGWLGYSFLNSSARAKILNWCTNVGALLIFIPSGAVHWGVGLVLAAGNMIGARLGAGTAMNRGSGFVRVAMIVVVSVLLVKLGADWARSLSS